MPNAWDSGSATILTRAGFQAIATTSAGIAYSKALPDYQGALTRKVNMASIAQICDATSLPVSADTESGYGPTLKDVSETILQTAAAGAVAGSIEDFTGDKSIGLLDISEATERVAAARQASNETGMEFTLTARAECFLVGCPNALGEAIKRLNRYREAGADCLYAPGPTDAETIKTLVNEVDGPINVVAGLSEGSLNVAELTDLGVKRISNGGVLMRVAMKSLQQAAREMMEDGTFEFAANAIPDAEISNYFDPLKELKT